MRIKSKITYDFCMLAIQISFREKAFTKKCSHFLKNHLYKLKEKKTLFSLHLTAKLNQLMLITKITKHHTFTVWHVISFYKIKYIAN